MAEEDFIKKHSVTMYTVYGQDFYTYLEAQQYAEQRTQKVLEDLFISLDHAFGKHGHKGVLEKEISLLHSLRLALNDWNILLNKEEV